MLNFNAWVMQHLKFNIYHGLLIVSVKLNLSF